MFTKIVCYLAYSLITKLSPQAATPEPLHFKVLAPHHMRRPIPEDIGSLSSLERLELSENNFMSLPKSISQLSNLRHFSLNNCSKLQALPKPPLSLKILQAHGCPMLNDQMTIWPSDKGFSFIDCRQSGEAEGFLNHHNLPMREEHIDQLFPKFIKVCSMFVSLYVTKLCHTYFHFLHSFHLNI